MSPFLSSHQVVMAIHDHKAGHDFTIRKQLQICPSEDIELRKGRRLSRWVMNCILAASRAAVLLSE